MGDLPASLAVTVGPAGQGAVAVDLPIGASEYLLAKPGITSIAQLRGKPVAYTTGTAEQAFALRALNSAGLTQPAVHQVNVSLLQLGTVLESGAADASVVSVEQKVDYEQTHPDREGAGHRGHGEPPSYGYLLATTAALGQSGPSGPTSSDLTRRLILAQNWAEDPPEPVGDRLLRQRRAPDHGRGPADPGRGRHRDLRAHHAPVQRRSRTSSA